LEPTYFCSLLIIINNLTNFIFCFNLFICNSLIPLAESSGEATRFLLLAVAGPE